MKILLSLIFLFLIAALPGRSQGNYVPPKIPAKYVKELQDAVLASQSGLTDIATGKILELIEKYPDWTEPRQELSRIYYTAGKKLAAVEELEASLAIDTLSQLQQLYTLGRLHEETGNPQKAGDCYKAVITYAIEDQELRQKATTNLEKLKEKENLWAAEYQINLRPFSPEINTPNHESLGRWTLDGQKLIFTRFLWDQEDIFIAGRDSLNSYWKVEEFTFNTPQNEGAHAVSPDGKYIIFTSCNRQDGLGSCDLYLSVLREGDWTTPLNMRLPFNSPSWDGQPCFGLDGLALFFSSDRPGGLGGRDIWFMYQISAGNWSKPVNAGPMINTADNEASPFIHFDGQTLYFMRDGQKGLGGYDLYMSRKAIDGKWQLPQNLGAPINSGSDEGAMTLHPDGIRAVITRETDFQRNDLFEFELPEKFRAAPLQALYVTITDSETHLPVRARVEVFEVDKLDTIRLSQWSDEEGKIAVTLQRNKNYGLLTSAEGYIMYSSNMTADTSAVRHLDISMIKLSASAEEVIVLSNIFFETASASLLPSSEPELNKLVWMLRINVAMKIEIRGHTDDVGDDISNQVLSEARAKSVYDYLMGRGIESSRLTYMGFGETQPIAGNTTPEGRKQNRRTEFRVAGI